MFGLDRLATSDLIGDPYRSAVKRRRPSPTAGLRTPFVTPECARGDAVYLESVQRFLDYLSETSSFEGLPAMDETALRLVLMRDASGSAPTSWSLFESEVAAWNVRRVWIDTRNSPRSEPFRYRSDAKLEPELADAILCQLEELDLPAFAAPGVKPDGSWRAVRRPERGSQSLDVALNWWGLLHG